LFASLHTHFQPLEEKQANYLVDKGVTVLRSLSKVHGVVADVRSAAITARDARRGAAAAAGGAATGFAIVSGRAAPAAPAIPAAQLIATAALGDVQISVMLAQLEAVGTTGVLNPANQYLNVSNWTATRQRTNVDILLIICSTTAA
jgi:hypothetical protein